MTAVIVSIKVTILKLLFVLKVRILPFQGKDMGSIPIRVILGFY